LRQLVAEGDAVVLGAQERAFTGNDFALSAALWNSWRDRLAHTLRGYHATQPLRPGMAREEGRNRMGITRARLFDAVVASAVAAGAIVDDGATLRLPDFQMTLDPARRARADAYLAAIRAQPYAPPGPHELGLDAETLSTLEYLGEITKIADGVYFLPTAWRELVTGTLAIIDRDGTITLGRFRDHFGTSRKYAQAALEQMDRLNYTRRVGDDRVRGPRRPSAA
jgi:selenocysteine-specific elongation factor